MDGAFNFKHGNMRRGGDGGGQGVRINYPEYDPVKFQMCFDQRETVTRSALSVPAEEAAQLLLGVFLVHRVGDFIYSGVICETEAYLGEHDPAAHVSRGRTPRTGVLYGPAGHAYVYRMHRQSLLNVSVGPVGESGCVLIRSVLPVHGIEEMYENRGCPVAWKPDNPVRHLCDGPGKLCQSMGITIGLYGSDMTSSASELFLGRCPGLSFSVGRVGRVGVSKAADWPLRFFMRGFRRSDL